MDCSTAYRAGDFGSAEWVICIVEPIDWRIYILPALAIISIFLGILGYRATWRIARRKATLDLIEKAESTEHYRDRNQRFSELRRAIGFGGLNNPQTPQARIDRQLVLDYLNHYEMIAIGIRNGVLDQGFYREWMRGPFVRDWNAAVEFIQGERWKREGDKWSYYPRTFANYQQLARRWDRTAFNLTKDSFSPPDSSLAGGPGDEPLPGAAGEHSS